MCSDSDHTYILSNPSRLISSLSSFGLWRKTYWTRGTSRTGGKYIETKSGSSETSSLPVYVFPWSLERSRTINTRVKGEDVLPRLWNVPTTLLTVEDHVLDLVCSIILPFVIIRESSISSLRIVPPLLETILLLNRWDQFLPVRGSCTSTLKCPSRLQQGSFGPLCRNGDSRSPLPLSPDLFPYLRHVTRRPDGRKDLRSFHGS